MSRANVRLEEGNETSRGEAPQEGTMGIWRRKSGPRGFFEEGIKTSRTKRVLNEGSNPQRQRAKEGVRTLEQV